MRAIIRDELANLRVGDIAVVTSVFPHNAGSDDNNGECNVKLRDADLELRRVPIATPHVGMVSAPRVGDLVYLSYVGGDPQRPIITGRLYADEARPPVHEGDEWRVESSLGSDTSITLDKDGAVVLRAGESRITVARSGDVTIQGKGKLHVDVDGDFNLSCATCTINASGEIRLG